MVRGDGRERARALRRKVQTAPFRPPYRAAAITYPLHPRFGDVFPIARGPFRKRGIEVVVVDVQDGSPRLMPVEWTDLRPVTPCPRRGREPVIFVADQLLAAARWCGERAENLPPGRSHENRA